MKQLLDYFYEISAIPRASYKEEKIAAYLMHFAEEHHLEACTDEAHNVLIRKAASSGYENAPVVVLQGHTDMVCEKNADSSHNFDTDGIRIIREGDRLRADGTTLGADDGFAVASMMAILADDTLPHPALECLFTTSEEVGMDGMRAFDKSLLHGRLMINLDSCEEAFATAACAGGVRTDFRRSVEAKDADGHVIRLFVCGLCGGHSGEDINRGRGNALKICARILSVIGEFRLIRMHGGDKDNAIPRECEAWILAKDPAAAQARMEEEFLRIKKELSDADASFRAEITCEDYSGKALSAADSLALLSLVRILPCGPLSMSTGIAGLVESSSNTAVVRTADTELRLTVSSRSSVDSKLDDICALLETCASLCGFRCEHYSRYPGWDFRRDSCMQKVYLDSAREVLGHEGTIIGIHAGLECGLLSRAIPDMDMISIGPDMFDIHTPAEQMSVSSAERVYRLVCHMLASVTA